MPSRALIRLRKLCLALPESHEVEAWGEPTFRVRNKLFAMMVRASPDRFFVPPYVGPSGWIVWLDGQVNWSELADLLRDSYVLVAPKHLRPQLEV
jgi:predicted DNA-binding protein (MmcQ/YjbR family)